MDEKLKEKIAAVLADDEDGHAHVALGEALQACELGDWLEAAAHEHWRIRMVAAAAARDEPEVRARLTELMHDAHFEVRAEVAQRFDPATPDDHVRTLLNDSESIVRAHAVRACASRAELTSLLIDLLADDPAWNVREAAAATLARHAVRDVAPQLLWSLAKEGDDDVARACATSLENLAANEPPDQASQPNAEVLAEARQRLVKLGEHRFPKLGGWLDDRLTKDADVTKLASFGTDLTREAALGKLARAYGADNVVAGLREIILSDGPRGVVLIGDAGSGKTAIVHELVHTLRDDDWTVIRLSPSELMAGTRFLGEWETKVAELIEAARAPRRVLVYMPGIEGLAQAGTHNKSNISIADMLAPHLESGALAILGESTPEAFRTGLGRQASFARLLTRVEIEPATREVTREVLDLVCAEADRDVDGRVLDRVMEVADVYRQGTAQPGRAVGLLRRVIQQAGARTIRPRHILETLHESTGIPVDFLDDEVPLDLDTVREFLQSRVMGQPGATGAIADLIALIKAGLTNPGKPYGVFLFVGPTGVGKTELARALAEYLFGDVARLLRFDMSEYATYAAYERLIGSAGQPGLLTGAVRDQPFSVVLLDEIEKSHVNVFDLCLQIFDAGRLTDGQGKTSDFRNTIVIMTSNVGANVPTESAVGFGDAEPPAPDRAITMRDLRRFFRPEFLNRIDSIVNFRQLEVETAERIARRELAQVVERSGIARRQLTVDIDDAVIALLLRQGYSPAFGARPLKRTVERMVLLPMARAIAGGGVRPGSVLRLHAPGPQVVVDILEPEATDEPATPVDATDLAAVRDGASAVRERAGPLIEKKAKLLARSNSPGFWDDRAQALRVLDEIHRLDKVLDDLTRLDANIERTAANPDAAKAAEFLQSHMREATRLAFLVDCGDLSDAIVTLTQVKSQNGGVDGVEKLARMYVALAARRGLEAEILDDRRGGEPPVDTITLAIGGAGAYALLQREAGLHHLSLSQHKPPHRELRDLVRIEVFRAPSDATPLPTEEVRAEVHKVRQASGRMIEKPTLDVHLLHLPTMAAVHARTVETALEGLHVLLRARAAGTAPARDMVRRYRLGPSPLVRDRRTGRSTGRCDQVLKGDLDLFLQP